MSDFMRDLLHFEYMVAVADSDYDFEEGDSEGDSEDDSCDGSAESCRCNDFDEALYSDGDLYAEAMTDSEPSQGFYGQPDFTYEEWEE